VSKLFLAARYDLDSSVAIEAVRSSPSPPSGLNLILANYSPWQSDELRFDNNLRQLYIFQTLQLYLFPWCRLVFSIHQSFPAGCRSIPPPEPLQTLNCTRSIAAPWLCFDSKHCALHTIRLLGPLGGSLTMPAQEQGRKSAHS
jgi:hypothetical protein